MKTIGKGIYRRGKVFWFASKMTNGKRELISLETKDEGEAIERVAKIKLDGVLEIKENFSSEVERFLADKRAMGKHTERSTTWFKETLKPFAKFVNEKPSSKVTTEDIAEFYKGMRKDLAETTAKSRMGALRSFFSWCVKSRRRFDNPTTEIKIPRISQPARTVFATKEQRDAIIAAAIDDTDLKFILLCAFHAGMRFNEISEARCDWFTLTGDSGFIQIQKTDSIAP